VRYHHLMEVSDVRRRVRTAIDEARRRAEDRRARKDAEGRAWEKALQDVVVPAFHLVASALVAEGYRFKVVTPGTTVRLVPERGGEAFVEVALETETDEPVVLIRSTQGRGRRTVTRERPLGVRSAADIVSDDEIVPPLLEELTPFLER
jgi:hypothetical protein